MRMLRSIYNRGVEAGIARFIPHLFRDVYTGVDVRQKKALPPEELHTLLYKTPQSEHLGRTQAIARLMFQFAACRSRTSLISKISVGTKRPQIQPCKDRNAHES